jgi:hypothetical protein
MMMHLDTMKKLHEDHYRDLLEEAEAWRWVRQAEAAQPIRPNLVRQIVGGVGIFLFDVSKRLTKRYTLLDDHSI